MKKLGCVVFPTLVGVCEGGLKNHPHLFFHTNTHEHETTVGLTKNFQIYVRPPHDLRESLTALPSQAMALM